MVKKVYMIMHMARSDYIMKCFRSKASFHSEKHFLSTPLRSFSPRQRLNLSETNVFSRLYAKFPGSAVRQFQNFL